MDTVDVLEHSVSGVVLTGKPAHICARGSGSGAGSLGPPEAPAL